MKENVIQKFESIYKMCMSCKVKRDRCKVHESSVYRWYNMSFQNLQPKSWPCIGLSSPRLPTHQVLGDDIRNPKVHYVKILQSSQVQRFWVKNILPSS